MSRVVLLDAGPLGLVTNPNMSPDALACTQWLQSLRVKGISVLVPEIADYEVRRELLRANRTQGVLRLDQLAAAIGYLPLTTTTMRRAAVFWAQVRNQGQQTADNKALDGDVILAAQAAVLSDQGNEVLIATTNVGHLSRLATALEWRNIQ
jgi:hypothetical protein